MAFPADLRILREGFSAAPQARGTRSQAESGRITQDIRLTKTRWVAQCRTHIEDGDIDEFNTWVNSGALSWFGFSQMHLQHLDTTTQVRVIDGSVSQSYFNRGARTSQWLVQFQLEWYV